VIPIGDPYLLPRGKYPITIEFFHPVTLAIVHSITVEEPAGLALVEIPPLARRLGHRVAVRIRFGDGEVQTA
jgi:hypothetical protein